MGTDKTETVFCRDKQAVWLTTMGATLHFLVDCLCLCCLYLTSLHLEQMMTIFITYNVCAFLTQPLTGWLADRMEQRHWMLLSADVLLALAVLGAGVVANEGNAFSSGGLMLAVAVLLGMGNSLFHVWGGKQVALQTGNDIRALGVFVSTGAFGLAVGAVFCSWGLLYLLLLFICLMSVAYIIPSSTPPVRGREPSGLESPSPSQGEGRGEGMLGRGFCWAVAMMLVVALRSFVGEAYTVGVTKTSVMLLTLGATAMLGKMAGGWLVKGLGMIKAVMLMVVGAALCWLGKDFHLWVTLLGLFMVNCTMPVTLYLANVALKGREGLAFGLLAAALIPGYLLATIGSL